MLNLLKKLFTKTKIPTVGDIRDGILDGTYTVDYDKFFIGVNDPKKYLINKLSKEDTWTNLKSPYHKFHLNCFVTDKQIGIFIDGNILRFHKYQQYGSLPDGEYNPINIDNDIEEVFSGSFDIPSGLIFISNNFSEKVNPEPTGSQQFNELSLNAYQGRKRLTKWYLDNNKVAYGQMGNMGLNVYFNKKTNHIILGPDISWGDDYSGDYKGFKKIVKGYKDLGNLSLSYWRWEAADSQTILSKSTLDEEKEIIQIPVKGTKVRFEHYYQTLNKSPLNKYCYAQLWIE